MSWAELTFKNVSDADEIASCLPARIVDGILGGEAAIERMDFRDRDEIITVGLARRAWPKETSDGMWKTWMTPLGCQVRDVLARRRHEATK